jgi:hypothetical protein
MMADRSVDDNSPLHHHRRHADLTVHGFLQRSFLRPGGPHEIHDGLTYGKAIQGGLDRPPKCRLHRPARWRQGIECQIERNRGVLVLKCRDMSSPAAFGSTAAVALAAAAEALSVALRQYQKTADLRTAWTVGTDRGGFALVHVKVGLGARDQRG